MERGPRHLNVCRSHILHDNQCCPDTLLHSDVLKLQHGPDHSDNSIDSKNKSDSSGSVQFTRTYAVTESPNQCNRKKKSRVLRGDLFIKLRSVSVCVRRKPCFLAIQRGEKGQ